MQTNGNMQSNVSNSSAIEKQRLKSLGKRSYGGAKDREQSKGKEQQGQDAQRAARATRSIERSARSRKGAAGEEPQGTAME